MSSLRLVSKSPVASHRAAAVFLSLLLAVALATQLYAADTKPYRLTILHTNDIHARIAEFNNLGQTCTQEESAKGECFGGYPRIAAAVEAARKQGGNLLLLDAGDQFQGTLFYTALKGRPSRDCMNALRYNAMTLGNHEFDDGPKVLEDTFLSGLTPPVLAANIDASNDPALKARLKPWTILTVGGRKIGLVGIANEDSSRLSNPGHEVTFLDAEEPLRKAVKEVAAQGADIVVAITHVGIQRDKELATKVDGIDVIVGGHSHTLLSNTDPKAEGSYPVVASSPSGRPVLIVQAGYWGRYLGSITVDFDSKGVPAAWSGAPVSLDSSKPQDQTMLARVKAWQEELKPFLGQAVGKTTAAFTPDCRNGECALGDVMADALRFAARSQGAQAAFVNGGAVRSGLKAGDISLGDLLTVYPFTDNVATFELTGKDLLEVLEYSVGLAGQSGASGSGRFLQVSGIKFVFDSRKPADKRIVTADIATADGGWTPIAPDKTYSLATSGYLLKGGDGYTMLKEGAKRVYAFGIPINDALSDYITVHSPLTPRLDGRIANLGAALPK